jgi:hypothetical protein
VRDPRIDQIADAVERHFPGTVVVISRCPSPDDPDIDWLLDVLNLPEGRDRELTTFTLKLGIELFGENDIPFLAGGHTPEWTALHYSQYLNGEPARP